MEIIGGIVAFFKAIPILDSWLRKFIANYMAGETKETLVAVADAAAFAAHANTKEERYAATDRWHAAMSRDRILSN